MIKEFKEFAMHGNVVDLAVGIIVGAGFGKVVTSLVNDIIMPPFGWLLGNVNFTNFFINLSGGDYATLQAARDAGAATINYGRFINTVLDFFLVSLVIFFVIRKTNKYRHGDSHISLTKDQQLLSEIRDALKTKNADSMNLRV